jgi:hypothetical protein
MGGGRADRGGIGRTVVSEIQWLEIGLLIDAERAATERTLGILFEAVAEVWSVDIL